MNVGKTPVKFIPPGSTIGIVGGGQLGRMLCSAAHRMGYRTAVLDPDPESPAAQIANKTVIADYADIKAVKNLSKVSDVITFEFENINADAVRIAEEKKILFPSSFVLRTTQDRIREKTTLQRLGLPTTEYRVVNDEHSFLLGLRDLGVPCVLKTATSGYDGKGQIMIDHDDQGLQAFQKLQGKSKSFVLERKVQFSMELSVICARDRVGKMTTFPVSENIHVDGILDVSIVPARTSTELLNSASNLSMKVAQELDVTGLIAVEMFLTESGELLINELAPRPHNSGHYTIDACRVSQFEQLVRILCGIPLGSTELLKSAAMVNLLGDVWLNADLNPNWQSVLADASTTLHLYGKNDIRSGRKMGHITVLENDPDTAFKKAIQARERSLDRI